MLILPIDRWIKILYLHFMGDFKKGRINFEIHILLKRRKKCHPVNNLNDVKFWDRALKIFFFAFHIKSHLNEEVVTKSN